MARKKYMGKYHINQSPNIDRMKKHNYESWVKIENVIAKAGGGVDFDALSIAVKGHKSGSEGAPHPHQFIIYCIDQGWLERV